MTSNPCTLEAIIRFVRDRRKRPIRPALRFARVLVKLATNAKEANSIGAIHGL